MMLQPKCKLKTLPSEHVVKHRLVVVVVLGVTMSTPTQARSLLDLDEWWWLFLQVRFNLASA